MPIDCVSAFHDALQSAFGALDWLPETDGAIHRFHVPGNEPGTLKGWCILSLLDGDTAYGCFGSWKAGDSWRSHPVYPLCQSEGRRISLSPNVVPCPL